MSDYIPLEECKDGHTYRINSRNLLCGVYKAAVKGFVGIREKLGREYLFTEFHWDTGAPFGTVRPIEDLLENCPVQSLEEVFVVSSLNGQPVVSVRYEAFTPEWEEGWREISDPEKRPSYYSRWLYAGTGEPLEKEAHAQGVPNKPLFNYLLDKEKELGLR